MPQQLLVVRYAGLSWYHNRRQVLLDGLDLTQDGAAGGTTRSILLLDTGFIAPDTDHIVLKEGMDGLEVSHRERGQGHFLVFSQTDACTRDMMGLAERQTLKG